jgi:hypothetical protein
MIGPKDQFFPQQAQIKEIQHRIKKSWIPIRGQNWQILVTAFTIHHDGHIIIING